MNKLSVAIETTKAVMAVSRKFDDALFQSQINELLQSLYEANIELLDVSNQLITAQRKIQELEAASAKREHELAEVAKARESFQLQQGVYWKGIGRRAGTDDGPFCAHCYEQQQRKVRLSHQIEEFYKCSGCQSLFSVR